MPASPLAVTADYTPASAIAFSSVPGLSFSVVAGVGYYFDFTLLTSAAASTTGLILALTGPATPTALRYGWSIPMTYGASGAAGTAHLGGASTYDHAVVPTTTNPGTASAPAVSTLQGFILPSVAGVVAVRVKPEVAAAMTVHRGSYGVVFS